MTTSTPYGQTQVARCTSWLRVLLTEGPTTRQDAFVLADVQGFSQMTVERAKRRLPIISTKGFQGQATWTLIEDK